MTALNADKLAEPDAACWNDPMHPAPKAEFNRSSEIVENTKEKLNRELGRSMVDALADILATERERRLRRPVS